MVVYALCLNFKDRQFLFKYYCADINHAVMYLGFVLA
jgi:hypothetical protein